jgi:hypothetical protein
MKLEEEIERIKESILTKKLIKNFNLENEDQFIINNKNNITPDFIEWVVENNPYFAAFYLGSLLTNNQIDRLIKYNKYLVLVFEERMTEQQKEFLKLKGQ